jgi:mannose-6-phosphate isomerase-like protein (cupin superfamily)
MSDGVPITRKSRAQEVTKAAAALESSVLAQATQFPRDHRPWGWLEIITCGRQFQVKGICVTPGSKLSLQSHHHLAEHWIAAEGTVRVTIGETSSIGTEKSLLF